MAITSLSELQTALTDRIARADFTTSVQSECIALAESEMQRLLKAQDMEAKTTAFTIQNEFEQVPANFLEVVSFWVTTSSRYPLQFMSDEMQAFSYQTSDKPKFYSVVGNQFHFAPVPDGTYTATLTYFQKIPVLSSTNTTNWLLTAYPDVYLYGACKHAGIRLKDPESAGYYEGLFKASLAQITQLRNRAKFGPGARTIPA